MASPEKSFAFIGLGVMGYPMAKNLRSKSDKDTTLYICDVVETAIERFRSELEGKGPIEVVKTGREAAMAADVVITMLPTGSVVKSVYLDAENGVLAGITESMQSSPRRKLIIECGTIESTTILEVAKAAQEVSQKLPQGAELDFVDAPVSGGPMGAEAGTLTFMVGCQRPDQTFSRIKDILSHMGKKDNVFLCGNVGAGVAFKIINNYISAITSLGASEALNIGVKLGLDPKTLTNVINASGGQNWITTNSNPVPGVQANVPSSRNYEGGFRIELCSKVLQMGIDLAEQAGARTVLDRPTLAAFEECMADPRYKGKDARVVYKWLNESESKQ